MSITLTPEQEAWIKAHAAEYVPDEGDDMAWAKPLVDEGRAAFERGDFITLEEHRARNVARLAALRHSGTP